VPGKPGLYATTKEFLDYFGLNSLQQLPLLPDIISMGEKVVENEEKVEEKPEQLELAAIVNEIEQEDSSEQEQEQEQCSLN
jgi:segregation and condensation protein B